MVEPNKMMMGIRFISVLSLISLAAAKTSSPPGIYRGPYGRGIYFQVGKSITFSCDAFGEPFPRLFWMKNGEPFDFPDDNKRRNSGDLRLDDLYEEDEGLYQCFAENEHGTAASDTIYLKKSETEHYATYSTKEDEGTPMFTKEPNNCFLDEGDTAVFECEATSDQETSIQWIHNGKPIEQAPPNPRRIVEKNKITISNLTPADTGNYGCNASNTLGYVYKEAYVSVQALPPQFREYPGTVETVDGGTARFLCEVFGVPVPVIKWFRNNVELTGERFKVEESGDLLIENVEFDDKGQYICRAENKVGSEEGTGRLDVRPRTRIYDLDDLEVTADDSPTLRCKVEAYHSWNMDVKWFFNGEVINDRENRHFDIDYEHNLKINEVTPLDSGNYSCFVKTRIDEALQTAKILVVDVPDEPVLTGMQCNAHEAVLTWKASADNNAPIKSFIVQYSTSSTRHKWMDVKTDIPPTDSSYTVPLNARTNYRFRVRAVNKMGKSLPSENSQVCTTPPDVPFKNPENVVGEGTRPGNLVIKWTPMEEIDHNGDNFYYRVSWKRDAPGFEWETKEVHDLTASELEVTDLPMYQRFKVRVQAVNEKGEAKVAAEEIEGLSGEGEPDEAPSDFKLMDISAKSVMVSWKGVAPKSVHGKFKGYKIVTWTEGEDREEKMSLQKPEATAAVITTITPNAINTIGIKAYNDKHDGPYSNFIKFKAPEGVPSSVRYLNAGACHSTYFMLNWQYPEFPNGKILGFHVFYEEVSGTVVGPRQERLGKFLDSNADSAKLSGLKPDTKYRVTVSAFTSQGEGEETFVEDMTLKQSTKAPASPYLQLMGVNYQDDVFAKVKVEWRPSCWGTAGSHFYSQYRKVGDPAFTSTKMEMYENYQIIEGLKCGTDYEFRVVSVNGDHETPSETKRFGTSICRRDYRTYGDYPENQVIAFISAILPIRYIPFVLGY